jgi:peptidoglycan/xylan/chitin deacetylase (PgdA/CDA1 family)
MEPENNLWSSNNPAQFWQVISPIDQIAWNEVVHKSIHENGIQLDSNDIDQFLLFTLGEGRFGEDHWNLTAFNRLYWQIKPIIPTNIIKFLRAAVNRFKRSYSKEHWPIDDRYIRFQWEIMSQFLQNSRMSSIRIKDFWPDKRDFSFVLTHDVEKKNSHAFIPVVADLEEKYGFRSSFNIVGDQIPEDRTMLQEIKARGFEIGLHGYHHDERIFYSKEIFLETSKQLNTCLKDLGAVGFRSPLNLRNPVWMQALEIEYDLSFFDTDPFEPISGGTMSIWPFRVGRFIELPATLVQDNTLVNFLGERTPKIWLDKVEFIKKFHGMALLNSHPDYLMNKTVWNVYESFLKAMRDRSDFWNALPIETTRWWRHRTEGENSNQFSEINIKQTKLIGGELVLI